MQSFLDFPGIFISLHSWTKTDFIKINFSHEVCEREDETPFGNAFDKLELMLE